MKKTLFIGTVLVMMTSSCSNDNEPVTLPLDNQILTNKKEITVLGVDCFAAYSRKCNFGIPLVLSPGQITNPLDVENYCRQTSISCPVTECTARLNVMFGFLPGSPKPDSCLPAGYRGK